MRSLNKYKKNPFRYRTFYEMLNRVIEKYNKKLITAAEIIDILVSNLNLI
ncbi:type I restriction enzyme endonuclease domain-containing protein [Anaerocellum danielii]